MIGNDIGLKTPKNSLFCVRNPSSKTRSWLKFQTQKVGIPYSPLSQIVSIYVFASKWWMIYLLISLRSFERFQGFLYISQTLPSFQQLDLPYSLSSPWPAPGLWTSPALPTSQRVSQCWHSLPAASVWREKSFAWMDVLLFFPAASKIFQGAYSWNIESFALDISAIKILFQVHWIFANF